MRAERRARWEQARTELAEPHRPPPPHVGRAVARRVRAGRTGRRVEVASDGPGQTLLSEAVVAEVVARAAGSVAGVAELREVEVTALSGSEVDLVVRLVADLDWRRPLGSVAGSVRHAVRSRLAAVAAVAVGRIDVEVAAAIAPAAIHRSRLRATRSLPPASKGCRRIVRRHPSGPSRPHGGPMPLPRFCLLVGLAIGAVWALAGVDGAAIAAGLALVGALVGLVLGQGIDLSALSDRRDDRL